MEYTFERFKDDFYEERIDEVYFKEDDPELNNYTRNDKVHIDRIIIDKCEISKVVKYREVRYFRNKKVSNFNIVVDYPGFGIICMYHESNNAYLMSNNLNPIISELELSLPIHTRILHGYVYDDFELWLKYAILTNQFVDHIEEDNKKAKEIITLLAENNVPFKVVQLGGGVKKIIKMTNVCPMCQGTGLQHPERSVQYPHTYK